MAKPLLDLIRQPEIPAIPPVWLMRQAGRYLPEYRRVRAEAGGFLDLCYSPELAEEVTLQPIRRYGFDASIVFADILLVPHALGQKLWFETGEGPRLEPISCVSDLSLKGARAHLAPVSETLSRLTKSLPASTTLIGFAGAPWTVATYMVAGRGTPDQAPARELARTEPEKFQEIIDMLVDATVDYLAEQISAGADVVQLFESWAASLQGEAFDRWCVKPVQAIISGLRAKGLDTPVIGFPRGAQSPWKIMCGKPNAMCWRLIQMRTGEMCLRPVGRRSFCKAISTRKYWSQAGVSLTRQLMRFWRISQIGVLYLISDTAFFPKHRPNMSRN